MTDRTIIATDDARLARLESRLEEITRLLTGITMQPRNPWLTRAEYKRELGVSESTVARIIRDGKVETKRIGGQVLLRAPWAS